LLAPSARPRAAVELPSRRSSYSPAASSPAAGALPAPLGRRQSVATGAYLPNQGEAIRLHVRFAALEQRLHREMSPLARRGLAVFADAGKSISLTVGAVAAWLGFWLAEPHLAVALGVAGAVWAGSILLGLCIELVLKWLAGRKVSNGLREELRELCVELNAREQEFGSYRHIEERHACEQANLLWSQIHFSGRSIARTLVNSVADYDLSLERPRRRAQATAAATPR
jgi:hypothetical protein